jgi:pimeloyl-ACP methyl ester carboxylesterase
VITRRHAVGMSALGMLARLLPAAAADKATNMIEPFRLAIPDAALADLRQRLNQARWPERETVDDWSQGVPLARLRALVEHWRTRYDWRRCEKMLNDFGQFRTHIGGLGIHFLHLRSPHADALPLILTHGWPGSVIEFAKVLGPLTHPTAHGGDARDAFHVVVPSLPGFGFSDRPGGTGWNAQKTAEAWIELMRRLDYRRFVAQGGDWGAAVTTLMGKLRPPALAGIHLNWPLVIPRTPPPGPLSTEEQAALDAMTRFRATGAGYFTQQATRPQTIGYALVDSPVGQAAWIYEKFAEWSDSDREPEKVLGLDAMLDDIMLYWLPGTGASSARTYWENVRIDTAAIELDLPVGCSIFPREIYRAPRSWAERCYKQLVYWNELPRGGHFAAFEQPELFTAELRACFRNLR